MRYWKPLRQAFPNGQHLEAVVQETMRVYELDREAAFKKLNDYDNACTYWRNHLYQVQMRDCGDIWHLNVRRLDGMAVHDWRHKQQIKNELCGEECEGVEIYPAESRLVDTSNKYHLWVFKSTDYKIPFGFNERDIVNTSLDRHPGLKQRSR